MSVRNVRGTAPFRTHNPFEPTDTLVLEKAPISLSSSKGVATQPAVESVMSQIYVMKHSIPESSVYLDCSRGVLLWFYGSFSKASNTVRFSKFYAYLCGSANVCPFSMKLGPQEACSS